MRHKLLRLVLLMVAVLTSSTVGNTQGNSAQNTEIDQSTYFITADTNDVQQVYHMLLDGMSQPRQMTYSAGDVLTFGIAEDALTIAYISDSHLWLQPTHTRQAESLTSVQTAGLLSRPVFSTDGRYIAYTDGGVWLYDLVIQETKLVLTDIPLADNSSNLDATRSYTPRQFVTNIDESSASLILDIRLAEWHTAGIYDLTTGELQMIEDVVNTRLLPLNDGRILIYGNRAFDYAPILGVTDGQKNITLFEEVLNFADLMEGVTPFTEQVIEIAPGVVRVFGMLIGPASDLSVRFYFDFDLMTDDSVVMNTLSLPLSATGFSETGSLSRDGARVSVYIDGDYTENGFPRGKVVILDVVTGEQIITLPDTVTGFQWHSLHFTKSF